MNNGRAEDSCLTALDTALETALESGNAGNDINS